MRRCTPATAVTALFLATGLSAGCYDKLAPPAPPTEDPATPAETPPERPPSPSVAGTGNLAKNLELLDGVIDKLGPDSASTHPTDRVGAATWRAAELEKLNEVVESVCRAGSAGCRDGLTRLVDAKLPPDELRGVLGLFLGSLRPQAETGFVTLGAHLLTHPDAMTRDLAFRMAVGAGVTRRGEPDAAGRRVALVPQAARAEQPAVVVIERASPCGQLAVEHKGPDVNGRIDVDVEPRCAKDAEPPTGPEGFPLPSRGVWALPIDSLPATGVSVWAYGAEAPMLLWRPLSQDKDAEGAGEGGAKAAKAPPSPAGDPPQ